MGAAVSVLLALIARIDFLSINKNNAHKNNASFDTFKAKTSVKSFSKQNSLQGAKRSVMKAATIFLKSLYQNDWF